jgi:hypothetical protein
MRANGQKPLLLFALFVSLHLFAQDSGSIAGTVVDSVSGLGIPEVTVYFGAEKGNEHATITDSSGRFTVSGLKNGEYGCHFEKPGYIAQFSGTMNSTVRPVRIPGETDPVRLEIRLVPMATLRGRVLDPDGQPAAKAAVTLALDVEMTDENGEFVFTDIRPGDYTIDAVIEPKPKRPRENEERTEPIRTWYPSAQDRAQAQTIHVAGGSNLLGYEIRIKSAPVYRVRGVVIGPDGKATRAAVQITPPDEELNAISMPVVSRKMPDGKIQLTDPGSLGYFTVSKGRRIQLGEEPNTTNGTFDFPSVPRGLHTFVASVPSENPMKTPFASSAPVLVDHDIDDLRIHIGGLLNVQGSVEITGMDKPYPRDLLIGSGISMNSSVTTGFREDGSVQFGEVSAGTYTISATPGLPRGYYLASITLGAQEILGRSIDLDSGAPALHFTYKPNGGTLSGTMDANAGAVVVLREADPQYGQFDNQGRTCTIRNGGFAIDSLAPGTYYAFAVDRMEPARYFDPQIAQRIKAEATVVKVSEGSSVSVKLPTIRLD